MLFGQLRIAAGDLSQYPSADLGAARMRLAQLHTTMGLFEPIDQGQGSLALGIRQATGGKARQPGIASVQRQRDALPAQVSADPAGDRQLGECRVAGIADRATAKPQGLGCLQPLLARFRLLQPGIGGLAAQGFAGTVAVKLGEFAEALLLGQHAQPLVA